MRHLACFITIITLVAIVGCGSNSPVNPVEPPIEVQRSSGIESNRYLWGLWEVRISSDHQSAEIIPRRIAEMHLNCVRMLEVTPCADCLTISNIITYPSDELTVDLTLKHPYPGMLKYTAFDVRGILITGSDYTFPISDRKIAWGDDLPRLLNADGCTSLFNPTEFPETDPPALGYIPGKYAPGGDLSATLNPYIAYAEDKPRRMFESGSEKTRTVLLRVPDGPLEFGYAVDGCWQLVDGGITDPLTDFPPDANCLEAYRIDVQVGSGLQPDPGSAVPIHVVVYDHQGFDSISNVTIEVPELFSGEVPLTFSTVTSEESFLFTGLILNDLGAGEGEYPLLVRVKDTEADQNLGLIDGWQTYGVDVGPKKGWARTWGGDDVCDDFGSAVAVDELENIYVVGNICSTVDLNPGSGIDYHDNGSFFSKFDSSGNYLWGHSWLSQFIFGDVAVDGFGNVYIAGRFSGTVDFDPGPGVDEYISHGGGYDAYVCKYDSDGNYQWTRTWGGMGDDGCLGVAIDGLGNVYVTGFYEQKVDFDPGPGVEEHTAHAFSHDAFLSKFNPDGEFQWVGTWGSTSFQGGYDVAIGSAGGVYVLGFFYGAVDFDPGPGVEKRNSSGKSDVFVNKLDLNGNFKWVCTWGGYSSDNPYALCLDQSENVYVFGYFTGEVDFDPGPDEDVHISYDSSDYFLSKLDADAEFQWARTWGGYFWTYGPDVGIDDTGNIFVVGFFSESVDFDPGPGVDEHISNGSVDVFLSKIDSCGEFQWARNWGGAGYDYGYGLDVDISGNCYVTGLFTEVADFDPGLDTDYHESKGNGDAFLSKFPPDGNW